MCGKSEEKKQRCFCVTCHKTFVSHNEKNKWFRLQRWFYLWIKEGYCVRQIVAISGLSVWRIKTTIHHWLEKPVPLKENWGQIQHVLFDGTYFHHSGCLICLFEAGSNQALHVRYTVRENYHTTKTLFVYLKEQAGFHPLSMTLDGNTTALRAVKEVWPNCIIQRCLVHIQRQGLSWLRRFPKTAAARSLRLLLLSVTNIRHQHGKQLFLHHFDYWLKMYGAFVDQLPKQNKVFSDLQRTKSLLINAFPDMFHYLDNPAIPFSTNSLEGFFSQAKESYRKHRGMRQQNREQFFRWYAYFKNKKG